MSSGKKATSGKSAAKGPGGSAGGRKNSTGKSGGSRGKGGAKPGSSSNPATKPASGGSKASGGALIRGVGVAEDRNSRHRRTMEDQHVTLESFAGDKDMAFFGVFDGHGGKGAAEYCKEHFANTLEKNVKASGGKLAGVLTKTYEDVDAAMKDSVPHAGSTAVTVLVTRKKGAKTVYTANAGDARGMVVRDGKALRFTIEHKPTEESEAKRVEAAGGFIVSQRVNGLLAVTRSLGDHLMKEYVIGTPHVTEHKLSDKDTAIILACDGVWDVMEDQEAVDLIKGETDATAAAEKICKQSLSRGTTDNVTVMVIFL